MNRRRRPTVQRHGGDILRRQRSRHLVAARLALDEDDGQRKRRGARLAGGIHLLLRGAPCAAFSKP